MGKLVLFHGDKGGVGKSFACQTYIDFRMAEKGNQEGLILVETDTRNPDVAAAFQSHMQVEFMDLKSHDGWMQLADLLAENKDSEIVVSLPAGIGHALETEAEYLAAVLGDLGHELTVFWPINRLKFSVVLLKEFLGTPLANLAKEIIVVKNGFFGDEKKFVRWNESKTRKEFLARKGAREVFLPELHERVVDAVAGPWSLAGQDLKYSERTELQRWLKEAHQVMKGAA